MKLLLHAVVLLCTCISTSTSSNPTSPFSSPNYPSDYPDDSDEWTFITVAPGSRIELTFVEFEIEHSHTCNLDYVEGNF